MIALCLWLAAASAQETPPDPAVPVETPPAVVEEASGEPAPLPFDAIPTPAAEAPAEPAPAEPEAPPPGEVEPAAPPAGPIEAPVGPPAPIAAPGPVPVLPLPAVPPHVGPVTEPPPAPVAPTAPPEPEAPAEPEAPPTSRPQVHAPPVAFPPTAPPAWRPQQPLLPWLPMRGAQSGLLLAVVTALFLGLAQTLGAVRARLLPHGILPGTLGTVQMALRIGAAFTALGAVAALLPRSLGPALPLVVVGAAIAVGWSARDLLPDLLAFATIAMERRLLRGQWVTGRDFSGVVESQGLRATWLRDAAGRMVGVPNHRLVAEPVRADASTHPIVEITVRVRRDANPGLVRGHLGEHVSASPWTAPDASAAVLRDPDEPTRWLVRVRLLEGRFVERLQAALQERADEAFEG